jgi:hypothetical protein
MVENRRGSNSVVGTLVLRRWDRRRGLHETRKPFHSLEELYALCLAATPPEYVDRIVLTGADGSISPRTLLFTYEASTGGDGQPEDSGTADDRR